MRLPGYISFWSMFLQGALVTVLLTCLLKALQKSVLSGGLMWLLGEREVAGLEQLGWSNSSLPVSCS